MAHIIFVCDNCIEDFKEDGNIHRDGKIRKVELSDCFYDLDEESKESFEGLEDFFCHKHNVKGIWMSPADFEKYKIKLVVEKL